jgi:hypothetical protein
MSIQNFMNARQVQGRSQTEGSGNARTNNNVPAPSRFLRKHKAVRELQCEDSHPPIVANSIINQSARFKSHYDAVLFQLLSSLPMNFNEK